MIKYSYDARKNSIAISDDSETFNKRVNRGGADKVDIMNKQYCLHDTKVENVQVFNKGIKFRLPFVYKCENGKETTETKPCTLTVNFKCFDADHIWKSIECISIKKRKAVELEFDQFQTIVNTYNVDIDDVFYSTFSSSLLIKGYTGRMKVEITLFDVDEAAYSFDPAKTGDGSAS